MLRARLYEHELRKQEAATDALNAHKTDNSWGNQIQVAMSCTRTRW